MPHQLRLDGRAQPRQCPRVQRVREREAARGSDTLRRHRAADQLGQLDDLGDGVRVGHGVADEDQRALGRGQTACRFVDRLAIPHEPRGHAGGSPEVEVALRVQHVDG